MPAIARARESITQSARLWKAELNRERRRTWDGRCKPDSVPPTVRQEVAVISLEASSAEAEDTRPACAAMRLIPGVIHPAGAGLAARAGRFPCYVLHRVGFVLPPSLQSERWALTPPFHPGRQEPRGAHRWYVFCDTFRDRSLALPAPMLAHGTLP